MGEMIALTQAAEYLGISKVTLWKLVNEGAITAYKDKLDRRKKLFKVADLKKLKTIKEPSR